MVFFFGDLVSICTKIMGPTLGPWNLNSKIFDEFAKKLQIKKKSLMKLSNCG